MAVVDHARPVDGPAGRCLPVCGSYVPVPHCRSSSRGACNRGISQPAAHRRKNDRRCFPVCSSRSPRPGFCFLTGRQARCCCRYHTKSSYRNKDRCTITAFTRFPDYSDCRHPRRSGNRCCFCAPSSACSPFGNNPVPSQTDFSSRRTDCARRYRSTDSHSCVLDPSYTLLISENRSTCYPPTEQTRPEANNPSGSRQHCSTLRAPALRTH